MKLHKKRHIRPDINILIICCENYLIRRQCRWVVVSVHYAKLTTEHSSAIITNSFAQTQRQLNSPQQGSTRWGQFTVYSRNRPKSPKLDDTKFNPQSNAFNRLNYNVYYIHIYTGCFTTLGHNCRRWFPRFLWSKKFI